MALFQLVLLATLIIGSFADHEPRHSEYNLPNSQVNFNTPAFTYKIPEVAVPVLPSFEEIATFTPKHEVRIPSTSYGMPVGPVRTAPPALLRPSSQKIIEFTSSGEIQTDLFDIFSGNQQQNMQQFLEYNPPITTKKPPMKPANEYYVPTTSRKPPTRPATEYYVPTTTRKPPTRPATEYYAPTTTTTTTTRRPTTTRSTTRAPIPTKPSMVYGTPPVKPATEYFVPTTTTTTTTTTTRKPTTTTTTTTTPKPTTTTTTTTTPKPTTTTTTTTEKVVYGPPEEKPAKPFDDYGPPMLPYKPFNKVTERPSYPYPPAGVPDLRHQHHPEVHIVPSYVVRKVPNPFFTLSSAHHFVPVHIPRYTYFK